MKGFLALPPLCQSLEEKEEKIPDKPRMEELLPGRTQTIDLEQKRGWGGLGWEGVKLWLFLIGFATDVRISHHWCLKCFFLECQQNKNIRKYQGGSRSSTAAMVG